MKSIQINYEEIILINGKIYNANINTDGNIFLECMDDLITDEGKNIILSKESNAKTLSSDIFYLKYSKYLKV